MITGGSFMKKYKASVLVFSCVLLAWFLLTRNSITLQSEYDTYPQGITSISVCLKNQTLRAIEYGAAFSVDQYVDGNWMRLGDPDKPIYFELWAKTLIPLSAVDLTYPVSLFSDLQEAGVYRLAIDVRSGTETETVFCSFTVSDK